MAPGGMSEELLNLRFMQRARFKQRHEVVAVSTDSRPLADGDKKSARFRSYAEEQRQQMQNFIDNFGLRWQDARDAELQKDRMFGRMSFNGANRELENVMKLEMEDLGQQQPDKNSADWRKIGEQEKKEGQSAAEYDVETNPNDANVKTESYDPEEMIKINDFAEETASSSNNTRKRRENQFKRPKALNHMRPEKSRGRNSSDRQNNSGISSSFLRPPGANNYNSRWPHQPNSSSQAFQPSRNQTFRPPTKRTAHNSSKNFSRLDVKKLKIEDN